jgi:hypothetical protein
MPYYTVENAMFTVLFMVVGQPPMPYCTVENAMFYQMILSYLPNKFIDTVTLFFSTGTAY